MAAAQLDNRQQAAWLSAAARGRAARWADGRGVMRGLTSAELLDRGCRRIGQGARSDGRSAAFQMNRQQASARLSWVECWADSAKPGS